MYSFSSLANSVIRSVFLALTAIALPYLDVLRFLILALVPPKALNTRQGITHLGIINMFNRRLNLTFEHVRETS